MPKSDSVDRDLLHAYLFRKSNARHRLTLHNTGLAHDVGVSVEQMSRIIKEMTEDGRMAKIGRTASRSYVYKIIDPEEWGRGVRAHPRR